MAMEINTKYDFTVQMTPARFFGSFWLEIHHKTSIFEVTLIVSAQPQPQGAW